MFADIAALVSYRIVEDENFYATMLAYSGIYLLVFTAVAAIAHVAGKAVYDDEVPGAIVRVASGALLASAVLSIGFLIAPSFEAVDPTTSVINDLSIRTGRSVEIVAAALVNYSAVTWPAFIVEGPTVAQVSIVSIVAASIIGFTIALVAKLIGENDAGCATFVGVVVGFGVTIICLGLLSANTLDTRAYDLMVSFDHLIRRGQPDALDAFLGPIQTP